MNYLISRGFNSELINLDDLSVDRSTEEINQISKEKGQEIGFDGYKRIK
jgi:DNA mismatch repair ATPase MutS